MTNSKMSIKVQFEIGHKAVLKAKKAADNFTHDWELYVKGVDKADISSYIEKIVFNLHESFPKPKRTFKEPPFVLKESGYAGFILPIDIHFKNRTMQTYQYDIDLQPSGPPVHKSEIKTHIFENSSEDFRQKLLKGGGILHGSLNEERIRVADTEFQHKLKTSSNSGNINLVHESSSKKSHKIRPEKSKVQNFENIFGKPITKTASTPPTINNSGVNINVLKSSSSSQEPKIKSSNTTNPQLSTNLSKTSNLSKADKILSNPNILNVKDKSEISEKSDKKEKHKHSSHKDKEKSNKDGKERKDDKHERREDRERKKDKSHSKERDRSTDKSAKSRIESPQRKKPRISSPVSANAIRKSPIRSSSSASKEEAKNKSSTLTQIAQNSSQLQSIHHLQNTAQHQLSDVDKKSNSSSSSSSKKSKKDKKSHDKDKERESRKDRENKNQKDLDQASRSSSTVSYQGNSGVAVVTSVSSNNNETNKSLKPDLGPVKTSSKSKTDQKSVVESTPKLPSPNTTTTPSSSKKSSEKHDSEEKRHKHKKKDKSKDKDKSREKEGSSAKEKDKKRDKKISKDDSKKNKEEDMGSTATSNSNLGPSESLHDSLFNSDHESRHSDADKVVHHSDSSNHTFAGNISKSKIPSQNNVINPPKLYSTNTTISQISSNDNITTVTEKKEKKSKDQKIEKEEKKRKRKSREGTGDSNASSSGSNINVSEAQSKIPKKI